MKKVLVTLTVFLLIFVTGCGTSSTDKFFGITPKEFMRRYNSNINRLVYDKECAERLKIDSFKSVSVKGEKIAIAFHTRQKYLALEIASINPEKVALSEQNILMVHLDDNDPSLSHFVDFKLMSGFAAYTLENKEDDPEGVAMTRTLLNLFDQFDRGNQAPIVDRNGFSFGLRHGFGDFGKIIEGISIVFFMGKS